MKYSIYFLLILLLKNVLNDNSASFCLCTLKNILKNYALISTERIPPRYRSSNENDIGFYVVPSKWKAVNNATWIELGEMINAPTGMYTHISIDGINPINNGLALNNIRSAHLADIITEYRSIIDKVDLYHENIIRNRTQTCLNQKKKSVIGFDLKNTWKQFFVPRLN
jgi:hypothetical protein